MADKVIIVREETTGKGGGKRTVYYLSNGWWINDGGTRGHREDRFALYRPGVGSRGPQHGTFIKSDNKLNRLLKYANELVSQE